MSDDFWFTCRGPGGTDRARTTGEEPATVEQQQEAPTVPEIEERRRPVRRWWKGIGSRLLEPSLLTHVPGLARFIARWRRRAGWKKH